MKERQVQRCLEDLVKEKRKNGLEAIMGYMKVKWKEFGVCGWRKKEDWLTWTFREKGGRRGIRMVSWNVAGVANAWRVSSYFKKFDIIVLEEMWLEKSKKNVWMRRLNKGSKWMAKAAECTRKKRKARGGVLIKVRKEIKCEEITEWKYGLMMRGLVLEKKENINKIVAVYNWRGRWSGRARKGDNTGEYIGSANKDEKRKGGSR